MRRGAPLILAAVCVMAIVASPTITGYNGGVPSQNLEFDCGGSSCHDTPSTAVMTMAASNVTPAPSGTLTLWVNVSGGEATDSPLGVMIVSATSTSNSLPSADGWEILADPSGTTTYNYYEVESYSSSVSLMWQLQAPTVLGTHVLFAQEMHGDGGVYESVYSEGLVFTVTSYVDDGDGDDDNATHVPSVTITSPSNAATVRGNMSVNANVISVDDIVSVTLKIDGELVGEKTAAPFLWVVDTTNLTDGGHVIEVSATDSTGDTVTTEVAVFVDNESELVSMLEWLVTMGAGTVAIISISAIMIVAALYIRKRLMSRRTR